MFKTAVITDEISQNLDEAAELAAACGLDAIEIRSVWDKNPHQLTIADIENIKGMCEKYNLSVCAISSPFFKCHLTQTSINAHIEILKQTIELAKALKCHVLRGFSFWSSGDFDKTLPDIVEAFKVPVKLLAENDICMVLESDPTVNACNGELLARLVEAINSPFVRVLWDPGNDLYSPIPEEPFPYGYERVKPYIAHVHIKDSVIIDGKPESVKIGTGSVNWQAQLEALSSDGYNGYISLETHYRKDTEIPEELMRKPSGAAFSYGGREASEECLAILNQMLKRLK